MPLLMQLLMGTSICTEGVCSERGGQVRVAGRAQGAGRELLM